MTSRKTLLAALAAFALLASPALAGAGGNGGAGNSSSPAVSRIIPGNWGKVGSGWLARPLQSRVGRREGGGRIHRFLRRRSRAAGTRKRNREARHDEKPCRARSSNSGRFRAWVNRSHSRECRVATVCQHGAKGFWRADFISRRRKPSKDGQREPSRPGRKWIAARSKHLPERRRNVKRCPAGL
jgi:hypothetical protein